MTTLLCRCGFEYPSSEVIGKILTNFTVKEQYLRIQHKCPRCNFRNLTYFARENLK